jgi:CDP-glucose 4,6-dehydratase
MVVTSDKVYQNLDEEVSFFESDRLGGDDPYSASKAAAELITHALDSSLNPNRIPIVSVRAGNVIGGGDWSNERLVPDVVRSIATKSSLILRSPKATRPWQHVLDCLGGYLLVAESQFLKSNGYQTAAVNFGPLESIRVQDLVEIMVDEFDYQPKILIEESTIIEKNQLAISSELAKRIYGWEPQMSTKRAIQRTAQWYSMFLRGKSARELIVFDIQSYFEFQE